MFIHYFKNLKVFLTFMVEFFKTIHVRVFLFIIVERDSNMKTCVYLKKICRQV